MKEVMYSALSPFRRWLVDLMSSIGFGWIERLVIHRGEPLPQPQPRIVRTVKLDGETPAPKEPGAADFALKRSIVELFRHLDGVDSGMVERLEVRHGLPLLMQVEGVGGPSSRSGRDDTGLHPGRSTMPGGTVRERC